jgi:flagellar biosynthetic protein FliR
MNGVAQFLRVSEGQLYYAMLLFLRTSGLFVLSPIFGRKNVPNGAKAGIALLLSYLFLSAYPPSGAVFTGNVAQYALLCTKELAIGLIMGYLTILFFDVAAMAGQLMDVQIGFGMAQIFDPETNNQVSLVSRLLDYALLLFFLVADGHHTLIRILFFSFEKIPVGQVLLPQSIALVVGQAVGLAFSMAVTVALPIIAAELLLEMALGILTRSVPQLNVFVVGITVKVAAGLLALVLFIPAFASYGDKVFEALYTWLAAVTERMVIVP